MYSCLQTLKLRGSRLRHWLMEVRSWEEHSRFLHLIQDTCNLVHHIWHTVLQAVHQHS